MDKAALLGQVVDRVKEDSKKAQEVSKLCTIPTEIDEIMIHDMDEEEEASSSENTYVKASICCDDRPGFLSELNTALKGVGVTLIEADISSLGGRIKTNFLVCANQNTTPCSNSIKNSLKLALSRILVSSGQSSYSARSKRQRFFYPDFGWPEDEDFRMIGFDAVRSWANNVDHRIRRLM